MKRTMRKGSKMTTAQRFKLSESHKGKVLSLEHRKKVSDSLKGKKKPPFSKEHRRKLSIAQKNRPITEQWLQKQRDRVGPKSGNWKGGISKDYKHYHRIRRNRKINAQGSHTNSQWENLKAQYNWTCPCCGAKEPNVKLAADHIVPLSKGGSDNIENIQPLCKSCNSRKKNIHSTKYEPK